MRLILIQLARLLAALVALYAALLALSLLVPRYHAQQALNSGNASSSLYMTEPKYVFFARGQLNSNADKVLLLGASNMLVGFKQPQVQALLPQIEVDNISVSGSNISQLAQVVQLVREVQSPEARRHNTYVLGLWYGLFAADEVRWNTPDRHAGDTDIDIERYRYGFYRRGESGPIAVLPPEQLALGALLIHPCLVLDRVGRDLTRSLRDFRAGKEPLLSDAQYDAKLIGEEEKRQRLAFWHSTLGPANAFDDASFSALTRLVDGIVAEGGHVVLVDLPIPSWHANGSALAVDYRRHMDALLPRLDAQAGVTTLKLAEADDEFIDEVHPKPRAALRWAQRLAAALTTAPPALHEPPGAILGNVR